jgi:hypothetical protein
MSSTTEQIEKLVSRFGLTRNELKVVKHLRSHQNVTRKILQRMDTKQYIMIQSQSSYQVGIDDLFRWVYMSEEKVQRELLLDRYC